MDDDRIRLGDRRGHLVDGPVADRNEEDVAGGSEVVDRSSRPDRWLPAPRRRPADGPADAAPCGGEGPRGPAASDDSEREVHQGSVIAGMTEEGKLARMRRALLLLFLALAASAE